MSLLLLIDWPASVPEVLILGPLVGSSHFFEIYIGGRPVDVSVSQDRTPWVDETAYQLCLFAILVSQCSSIARTIY